MRSSMNTARWIVLCRLATLCLTLSLGIPAFCRLKADGIQRVSFTFAGQKSTCYLFVPDSASAGAAAPLIVLLRGAGEDGLSLAAPWRGLALREGIILIAPDSEDKGPDFIVALVESLRAKAAVNPRRIYLFGHSAGGRLALILSLVDSEYFAAVAVHAGRLKGNEPAPGFGHDLRDTDLLANANRKIPIAMWNGTLDQTVPLADARATRDILEMHGFPVELHEMLGRDHNYYIHSDEVNEAAWDFLRQHELEHQPTFQRYKKP